MLGVVNDVVPVPLVRIAPPVDAAYQSIVSPVPAEAERTTVPVPHLALFVPEGTEGIAFTVAVTAILLADRQPVVVFLTSA